MKTPSLGTSLTILGYIILLAEAMVIGRLLGWSSFILCAFPALFFGNNAYHERELGIIRQRLELLWINLQERREQR